MFILKNDIGEYIKSLKKSLGLTLMQLEKKSNVSNSYISQLENGHFKPSPDVLNRLSKALQTDFFDLMVRAGYMSVQSKEDSLNKNFVPNMINQLLKLVFEDLPNNPKEEESKTNGQH